MARIKTRDGGDIGVVLDYLFPVVGVQAMTSGTATVALTTIAVTDIVLTQMLSSSSITSYITSVVITAGTGFTVLSQAATNATLAYAVFHPNA
jgi:hypothetical protein